jgi:hypothetical protein
MNRGGRWGVVKRTENMAEVNWELYSPDNDKQEKHNGIGPLLFSILPLSLSHTVFFSRVVQSTVGVVCVSL